MKLGDVKVKSDPFGGGDCGRDNWYQCLTKPITCKWVPCWRRNVTYLAECLRCQDEGVLAEYHGETCKSLQVRSASHMDKL